jgi:hypothetical protein
VLWLFTTIGGFWDWVAVWVFVSVIAAIVWARI